MFLLPRRPVRIETERLTLRQPVMADFRDWSGLRAESAEFLIPWEPAWAPDHLSRKGFSNRVWWAQRAIAGGSALPLFLIRREDGVLLGAITLDNIRRGPAQSGNLGYWIGVAHARQGYMAEAISGVVHHAFERLDLSRIEAACLPETFFTVWSNVFGRGALKGGERFLVHGGSSGIGTTAIQLAHAFGARVFATAGSAEKCAVCERLGAERAINYREEDFVEVLRAESGADLILDMVGGDYLPRNVRALADDGRLVQIAFLQGPKVELNFAQVMMRRLTITGSTLRPQSDLAKARIAEGLRAHVWPLIEAGRIAPVMDSEFPLEEAAAAHERMESSAHIGKIVLRVD